MLESRRGFGLYGFNHLRILMSIHCWLQNTNKIIPYYSIILDKIDTKTIHHIFMTQLISKSVVSFLECRMCYLNNSFPSISLAHLNPRTGSLCAGYIFTLFILDCQYLMYPAWSAVTIHRSEWLHCIARTAVSWAYNKRNSFKRKGEGGREREEEKSECKNRSNKTHKNIQHHRDIDDDIELVSDQ